MGGDHGGMPEGDTVWLAAQRMNTALAGATLTKGELRVPQLATVDLAGATVTEVVPRGKHMLTRFADGRTLRTHYRMDGSWHIYRKGAPWKGGPAHSIRAVLSTGEWDCVGYRLHDMTIVPTSAEADLVGHLGPERIFDVQALPQPFDGEAEVVCKCHYRGGVQRSCHSPAGNFQRLVCQR